MENDAKYRAAKRHVEALKGLYVHAVVFGVVMACLFALNYALGGRWWALWPLFGWGAALLLHAVAVYGQVGKVTKAWEEKKIRTLMERP